MTGLPWAVGAAVAGLLLGLAFLLLGRGLRRLLGLGGGRTVALDNLTLVSRRYRLLSRPDQLIRKGGMVIPVEWKSSHRVRPWHRVQLGVDFLLIEERFKVRPTHGFIETGDGTRHRVENDDALRALVLALDGQLRKARAAVGQPIPVNPKPGQCPPCGMLGHCGQARI